jgi:hypothetical protein
VVFIFFETTDSGYCDIFEKSPREVLSKRPDIFTVGAVLGAEGEKEDVNKL